MAKPTGCDKKVQSIETGLAKVLAESLLPIIEDDCKKKICDVKFNDNLEYESKYSFASDGYTIRGIIGNGGTMQYVKVILGHNQGSIELDFRAQTIGILCDRLETLAREYGKK